MSEIIVIQETTEVVEVNTPGVPGPAGPGVPAGGAEDQILAKASAADYDTEWVDNTGGSGAANLVDLDDVTGQPPQAGEAPVWDGDSFELTNVATQAELDAHIAADVLDGDAAGGVLSGTYPNPGFAADMATQAELDAHINDAADAHDASAISILDAANDFTATDVEGALAELQSDHEADAQALADHIADAADAHDASAISVVSTTLSGTGTDVQAVFEEIDNLLDDHSARHENGGADEISIAGLSGTSEALQAHLDDTVDAHDASAVSVDSTTLSGTGTTVQASLEELDNLLDDHSSRHEDGGADEISIQGLSGTPTALTDHLNDATDAHDASAISFVPAGTIAATDVQAAIEEVALEAGSGSGTDFSRDITQTGHGLAVGDVVRFDGADYVKAQADSAAHAEVIGIVTVVAGVDDFTVCFGGYVSTLSGLSAGSVYYLDDDTAGLLTTTEPPDLGDVSKPLLVADSTTSGYFFNWRGAVVADPPASALVDLTDVTGGPPGTGEAPVWDGDSFEFTDVATQAELDAHISDTSDAHDASAISFTPNGSIAATDVQAAIEEVASGVGDKLSLYVFAR